MALIKLKEFPLGYSGSYWKVTDIRAESKSPEAILSVTMKLFRNKSEATTGDLVLAIKYFKFEVTKMDVCGDIFELAYNKIKTYKDAELEGAEDS